MKRKLWFGATCIALAVIVAAGCNTLCVEGERVFKRIVMPSDIAGTIAEIDQTTKNLEAARAGRASFGAGAIALGVENNASVKKALAAADKNIADGEAYLSRLESWKRGLEAALVEKVIADPPILEAK